MSEEPESFSEYDVADIGRVIAHQDGWYHVRMLDGRVCGFPAAVETSEANAAADIAAALADPVLPPLTQQAIWEAKQAEGYYDATEDLTLKTTVSAQNRFAGMMTLVREALDAEVMTGASEVTIFDASNVEHTLTVTAFRALMLRYGLYWKSIFDEFAP